MPTEEGDKRNGKTARASDVLAREEKVTDLKTTFKYQHQVDTAVAMAKQAHTTDMEAQKDLNKAERRGVEAAFDYLARRDAGMPPKDEYNSKDSRYSRENIEDGLLHRETHNGLEYGITWDKNGELISIQKGGKGSVMTYNPLDKNGVPVSRDGIMTHTHPSEIWDTDNKKLGRDGDISKYNDAGSRLHGLAFSEGDVGNHGTTQRLETRAVGREGTYIMRGNNATLSDSQLAMLRIKAGGLAQEYERGDKWVKNKIAMKVAAKEIAASNRDVMKYGSAVLAGGYPPTNDKFFNSQHCLALMAANQKAILAKYGIQFEFKPAKGYEAVGRAANGGTIDAVRAETKNFKTGTQIYREIRQEPPKGVTPLNSSGDTIPAGRTANGLATRATGGDGQPKRKPAAPKPPKVTDPEPPKEPKGKAGGTPPKTVTVSTPTGNYTAPTTGLFSGGLSGGGGFLTGGGFNFGR
jgi:hypothetical protein